MPVPSVATMVLKAGGEKSTAPLPSEFVAMSTMCPALQLFMPLDVFSTGLVIRLTSEQSLCTAMTDEAKRHLMAPERLAKLDAEVCPGLRGRTEVRFKARQMM